VQVATNQMRREAAKRKLERQQARRVEQAKKRKRNALITAIAVVVAVLVVVVVLVNLPSGGETEPDPAAEPTPTAVTPESIPTEIVALPQRTTPLPDPTSCAYTPDGSGGTAALPPADGVSASGTVPVAMVMNSGLVPLTLDRALAPCTVNSFVSLAQQGYFDGTTCHRLTTDPGLQVLQCGDPTGTGTGGPGYTIPDEVFPELTYGRGLLAMANTGQPDTGGSQFFMVYGDGQLPPQYTVFGSIDASGLDVIDAIANRGHDGANGGGDGTPIEPVTIESVSVG
jgi:peptidyl-prolyl cis-trans isomerase B (cyclophilin B)